MLTPEIPGPMGLGQPTSYHESFLGIMGFQISGMDTFVEPLRYTKT